MKHCYQMSAVCLFLITCQIIQVVHGNVSRKRDEKKDEKEKRGFFSFNFPFASNDETSTIKTITVDGDVAKTVGETKAAGEVSTVTTTVGEVSTVTTTVGEVSTNTTGEVSDLTRQDNAGAVTTFESYAMNIISIGRNDVEHSMMVAAPYLPLLYKVAVFIVPGLSSYQLLVLAVNVATITIQAVRDYQAGQSVARITAETGAHLLYDNLLKRDTINTNDGTTISEYATNIYKTLKNVFRFRYGHNSQEKSEIKSDDSDKNAATTNTAKTVKTAIEMFANDVDETSPETQTTVTNNYKDNGETQIRESGDTKVTYNDRLLKKVEDMRHKNIVSENVSLDAESSETDDDDDENDGSEENYNSEENDLTNIVEVNQMVFDKLLKQSMAIQPKFIQEQSGKELVEYLNCLKIELPKPKINSEKVFEVLTNNMDFDDSITDEKIAQLNDILSKVTDYYIATALSQKHNIDETSCKLY